MSMVDGGTVRPSSPPEAGKDSSREHRVRRVGFYKILTLTCHI